MAGEIWYNIGSGIWQGWNGSVITTFGSGGACPTCLVSTADVVLGFAVDRLITMDAAPGGVVGGNIDIVGGSASNITDVWNNGNGGSVHIVGGDGATGSCLVDEPGETGEGGNGGYVFIDAGNAGASVSCDGSSSPSSGGPGGIVIGSSGDADSLISIGNIGSIFLNGAGIVIGELNSSISFGSNGSSSVRFLSPTTFNSSVSFGANSTILPTDKAVPLGGPANRFLREWLGGTTAATGDWVITGWGANATKTAFNGSDSDGTLNITAGTAPSANPTAALTFKDGTWTNTPVCLVQAYHTTLGIPVLAAVSAITPTVMTIKILYTPLVSSSWVLSWHCFG
jgi:hypothetical protein